MRSRPGTARTILLSHIISARPPKQPLFFFPRGLGWRMHFKLGVEVTELSTNKQHHLSTQFSNLYTAVDTPARAA